jgi:hypothetical protein
MQYCQRIKNTVNFLKFTTFIILKHSTAVVIFLKCASRANNYNHHNKDNFLQGEM